MPDSSIEALTRQQFECLKQAAKGLTSKQIARITGYSPGTIDAYLSKAAHTLGVRSRREAVLTFKAWQSQNSEKSELSQSFVVRAIDPKPILLNILPSEAKSGNARHEERRAGIGLLPPIGGRENDLTSSQRLIAALEVALFSALLLLATVLVLKIAIFAYR